MAVLRRCLRCDEPFWSDETPAGWGGTEYCGRVCKRRAHHARRAAKARNDHRDVCPTPTAYMFKTEHGATKYAVRHQRNTFQCPAGGAWHVTDADPRAEQ